MANARIRLIFGISLQHLLCCLQLLAAKETSPCGWLPERNHFSVSQRDTNKPRSATMLSQVNEPNMGEGEDLASNCYVADQSRSLCEAPAVRS